jgi:hypothetical protein
MNPFDALGLTPAAALTDTDVRAAWRDIATATHPDLDGGGDPAAYAAAAAAYRQLRTPWGRSEALADLDSRALPGAPPEPVARGRVFAAAWRSAVLLPARVRHGRPGRLAIRSIVAVAAAVLAATVGFVRVM